MASHRFSNSIGALSRTTARYYRMALTSGLVPAGSTAASERPSLSFKESKEDAQHVILEIKRDAGKLNTVHPRVVVEPGGEYFEGIPELVAYSVLWAKAVGSLGLICVVVPLGFQLLSRRKSILHGSSS